MTRRRLSAMQRLAFFEQHNGVCHICERKIRPGELWDRDHVDPLAMSDNDAPENWKPAHKKCHKGKTKQDVRAIAKAKRVKAKAHGMVVSRNPLPET